mmetsp:Transcript_18045/g.49138  ORF Transcript_18045/g.49138 Transcript_18045/m.49138 type:complete len:399 (-) Transcript_18045:18-1214(-)
MPVTPVIAVANGNSTSTVGNRGDSITIVVVAIRGGILALAVAHDRPRGTTIQALVDTIGTEDIATMVIIAGIPDARNTGRIAPWTATALPRYKAEREEPFPNVGVAADDMAMIKPCWNWARTAVLSTPMSKRGKGPTIPERASTFIPKMDWTTVFESCREIVTEVGTTKPRAFGTRDPWNIPCGPASIRCAITITMVVVVVRRRTMAAAVEVFPNEDEAIPIFAKAVAIPFVTARVAATEAAVVPRAFTDRVTASMLRRVTAPRREPIPNPFRAVEPRDTGNSPPMSNPFASNCIRRACPSWPRWNYCRAPIASRRWAKCTKKMGTIVPLCACWIPVMANFSTTRARCRLPMKDPWNFPLRQWWKRTNWFRTTKKNERRCVTGPWPVDKEIGPRAIYA